VQNLWILVGDCSPLNKRLTFQVNLALNKIYIIFASLTLSFTAAGRLAQHFFKSVAKKMCDFKK
jgi:hypothetical protein